jgi:hypothetical protein
MKKRRGWSLKRELPILWSLCAREEPPHAGAVLVGLGQQFDALALVTGSVNERISGSKVLANRTRSS